MRISKEDRALLSILTKDERRRLAALVRHGRRAGDSNDKLRAILLFMAYNAPSKGG